MKDGFADCLGGDRAGVNTHATELSVALRNGNGLADLRSQVPPFGPPGPNQ